MSTFKEEKSTENKKNDPYLLLVLGLVALITVFHYITPIRYHYLHEIYRRIYHIPIIIAAFRFKLRGGFSVALAVIIVYLPHVVFQWQGTILNNLTRFTEILLYLVTGSVAGFLSSQVQKENEKYKRTADELQVSYKKLEEQTLKLAETESHLLSADRLAVLGELSASLAHEVRNPLGSIKGAADIIKKRCAHDNTAREFTDVLTKEVARLNQVVENYLSMTRKPSSHKEISDLHEAVKSILQLMGPEIRRKNIQIIQDFQESSYHIIMHAVEIRQVLLNIFLNALSAMANGGKLTIKASRENNKTILTIKDTGKGISTDVLGRIFEPFFTTKKEGTGLGLAIAKRIMENHSGQISVESEMNKGTTLSLIFKKAKQETE